MPSEDRIGPIPFIYNLISQGINATEGLRQYREAGGAIRTQRWYHAYGEIAAELAVLPQLQAAPTNEVPSGDLIRQRMSNRPGGFLARVGVLVSTRTVDPTTGRVSETTMTNWGSVRMQTLATLDEILALGEENFGPTGQSGLANSTVIGSILGPVEELIPLAEE